MGARLGAHTLSLSLSLAQLTLSSPHQLNNVLIPNSNPPERVSLTSPPRHRPEFLPSVYRSLTSWSLSWTQEEGAAAVRQGWTFYCKPSQHPCVASTPSLFSF